MPGSPPLRFRRSRHHLAGSGKVRFTSAAGHLPSVRGRLDGRLHDAWSGPRASISSACSNATARFGNEAGDDVIGDRVPAGTSVDGPPPGRTPLLPSSSRTADRGAAIPASLAVGARTPGHGGRRFRARTTGGPGSWHLRLVDGPAVGVGRDGRRACRRHVRSDKDPHCRRPFLRCRLRRSPPERFRQARRHMSCLAGTTTPDRRSCGRGCASACARRRSCLACPRDPAQLAERLRRHHARAAEAGPADPGRPDAVGDVGPSPLQLPGRHARAAEGAWRRPRRRCRRPSPGTRRRPGPPSSGRANPSLRPAGRGQRPAGLAPSRKPGYASR